MQLSTTKESFLQLVRLGIGYNAYGLSSVFYWSEIQSLANKQGLMAIVLDGIEQLPEAKRPHKELLLQWIGLANQDETYSVVQHNTACEMALLFHKNYIRTYVLKGEVIAECYPNPQHRVSSDLDCFLLPEIGDFDAWLLGNDIIKAKGVKCTDGFYKNSTFYFPGAIVENHRFMIPFRGNKQLKNLEIMLEDMLRGDKGRDRIGNTLLCRPPVMVTALFLIEHAYSHFLHEGLTWRHVLDWMMYSRRHKSEIEWDSMTVLIDEFGFRKFYDSFHKLGCYLLGELSEADLDKYDKRMLADVWAPLDLHETLVGIKGKLGLVGNTLRAWWKYHYFAEISMLHALWIQVYGFLFEKHPALD